LSERFIPTYQTTRCHYPEDSNMKLHRRKIHKSSSTNMGEHPAKQESAAWSLVRLQSRGYAIRGMEVSEKLPQEHGDAPCTIADCA
jgi:hypothetical protein